jgi:L-aspartate oxidase
VYLDARGVRDVVRRFPTAAEQCREVGLDIAHTLVPVAPAAHYFIGGVLTDLWGRTTLPGLFAAGEAASSGVHGANRLASNSLAEALVFGARAARAEDDEPLPRGSSGDSHQAPSPRALSLAEIRASADRILGVRRVAAELGALLERLGSTRTADGNVVATLVAWLVAASALRREESRGGHYREDFPVQRPEWRFRQAVDASGWWSLPVPNDEEVGSI